MELKISTNPQDYLECLKNMENRVSQIIENKSDELKEREAARDFVLAQLSGGRDACAGYAKREHGALSGDLLLSSNAK